MEPDLAISLPARIEYRDHLGALIVEMCRIRFPDDRGVAVAHHLVSAFNEAFNNTALHAYDDGAPGPVRIEVTLEEHRAVLTIADHGRSFDPATVAEPDLEALPEGGLGLFIIRSVMNEVTYQAGAPNVLRMVKHLER